MGLSGFNYADIQFDKSARLVEPSRYSELLDEVTAGTVDDVIILAHGWNNNISEARHLYEGLAGQLRSIYDSGTATSLNLGSRKLALLGLLWPSKKFTESTLIPGGAAAVGSPVTDAALTSQIDDVRGVFDAADADDRLTRAQHLISKLDDSPAARDELVDTLRGLLPGMAADPDDVPSQLWELPGREVLARLAPPVLPTGTSGGTAPIGGGTAAMGGGPYGAATGSAVRLGLPFGGMKAASQRLLNLFTYYQMKARAGAVGAAASNILHELRERRPGVGLHLVGHSFGGRLVTAASVTTIGGESLQPSSVTLLQAAFSHYGFARSYDGEHDGFFRKMITDEMVGGPVLVTHSVQDLAVGLAYPLASRLAQQAASWLGDANDRYGGIGRNGAQKTPESVAGQLLTSDKPYMLTPQKVHNLRADSVITGHSDIVRPEVAYAILSAITSA
jgi:hypothetical protein